MRNKWKRIISVLFAVMITLTMLPALGGVQTIFAAGGTPKQDGDVYLIEDAQDFAAMAADGNYKLAKDITVTKPYASAFSGTFDGDGRTIHLNLSSESANTGLFKELAAGATVKNFTTDDQVTSTANYTGAVAGKATGGTDATSTILIESVTNKASINGTANLAGIIGWATNNVTIRNCANYGAVTGSNGNRVGGILGWAGSSSNTTIENCANHGAVVGSSQRIGGIVGNVTDGTVTISNSYNTGSITGTGQSSNMLGGIIGQTTKSGPTDILTNCYSIGKCSFTKSTNTSIGSLLGNKSTNGTITNCFVLNTSADSAIGGATNAGVKAKTAEQMKAADFLTDLGSAFAADKNTINDGYPILAWEAGGSVTPVEPRLLVTPADLQITTNEANPSKTINVSYTAIDETTKINWSITSGEDVISLIAVTDGNENNSKVTVKALKPGIAVVKAETEDEAYSAEATINVYPAITTVELPSVVFAGETVKAKVNCLGGIEYDTESFPPLTGFTWKYYDSKEASLSSPSSGTQIQGSGMEVTVPAETAGKWLTVTFNGNTKGVLISEHVEVASVDITGAEGSGDELTAKTGTTLTAVAKGADGKEPTNLTYQWQKYGTEWADIDGETGKSFTVPDTKDVLNTKYRVIVSGENASTATSKAVLINAISDKLADADILEVAAGKYPYAKIPEPVFGTDDNICTFLKNDLEKKGVEGISVSLKSATKRSYHSTGEAAIAEDGTITYYFYDPLHTDTNGGGYSQFDVVFTLTKGDASRELAKVVNIQWDVTKLVSALKTRVADKVDADLIKGENTSLSEVTGQLELPSYITEDGSRKTLCGITWTSSNSKVIEIKAKDSTDLLSDYIGKVTRSGEDQTVTLTATFDYKNVNSGNTVEANGIKTLTKTFAVVVKAKPVPAEAELLEILNTYYTNDLLTDSVSGQAIDLNAVEGNIQLPRYTKIKDKNNNLVFENKEIVVTSDSEAAVINGYSVAIDQFKGGDAKLTVTFTRDGVSASKVIPIKIVTLSDEVLDKEITMMTIAKEHYFDGLNDGKYPDKDSITGNLHAFQEMTLDAENQPVWTYNNNGKTGKGIIPDDYFDDPWEMEGAGYNRFKSSDNNIVQHENLVVVRPEGDTKVTITSWLSSELYGKYAKKYPENEKLQKLYKQEVSVEVTVKGTKAQEAVLSSLITDTEAMAAGISEGNQPGDYPAGTKDKLAAAIAAAKSILSKEGLTEDEATAAIEALQQTLKEIAAVRNPILVYLTVSDKGILAKDNDANAMAKREVLVSDLNGDAAYSFDEALVAAHKTYNSEDGYVVSGNGLVTKLWGQAASAADGAGALFFLNGDGLSKGVKDVAVENGDQLTAALLVDTTNWNDWITFFDKDEIKVKVGKEAPLTLMGHLGNAWTEEQKVNVALSGIPVGLWKDGSFEGIVDLVTDTDGKAVLTFDEAGEYIVTAYGKVQNQYPTIAPFCKVTVTVDTTAANEVLGQIPENLSSYTDESVKAVTEAREKLESAIASGDQSEINSATQALEAAIAQLTAKPIETKKSLKDAVITLKKASYTFTGKAITPVIASVSVGDSALSAKDYTVSCSKNIHPGKAYVTITGKGNYTDSARASFTIAKAKQPITIKVNKKKAVTTEQKTARKNQKLKGLFKIKNKKSKVSFKVVKVSKKKFAKMFTINKKGQLIVKKGVRRGTYKVYVRITAKGTADYKPFKKIVAVNVKVK